MTVNARAFEVTRKHGSILNYERAMWSEQEAADVAAVLAVAEAETAALVAALPARRTCPRTGRTFRGTVGWLFHVSWCSACVPCEDETA